MKEKIAVTFIKYITVKDRDGHPTFFGMWATGLGGEEGKNTGQEMVAFLFIYMGDSVHQPQRSAHTKKTNINHRHTKYSRC